MRIAVLTGLFPVLWETPFLNQITGLVELGHDIEIYADQPQPGVPAHPDIARLGLLDRTRYPVQLPTARIERWQEALRLIRRHQGHDRATLLRTLNPLIFWRRATSLDQLRRTAPLLPPQSYDICYCPFAQDARRILRYRKLGLLRGRLVTAFRGSDFSRYLAQRGAQVYGKVFREGDLFLPVCEAFAARLRSLGCPSDKVMVHHTGINLTRFPFRPRSRPAGALRLITVGRLVEKKGVSYALQAISRLRSAGLEVSYHILGDGPLRESLQREAEQLGIQSRVRFSGWRTQAQVQEGLNEAHVLLAPCVTAADGDQEGIPNVLREGMAAGLPVIGSFHSGIPELIEDGVTGYLVPERDPAAIADRIRTLAVRADVWLPMVTAARRRVERDDIYQLNLRLAQMLEGLLRAATPA